MPVANSDGTHGPEHITDTGHELRSGIEGEVEFAGMTALVQDEQLMLFFPGGEGTSEPITWNTCRKLLFLLKLVIETARKTQRA